MSIIVFLVTFSLVSTKNKQKNTFSAFSQLLIFCIYSYTTNSTVVNNKLRSYPWLLIPIGIRCCQMQMLTEGSFVELRIVCC